MKKQGMTERIESAEYALRQVADALVGEGIRQAPDDLAYVVQQIVGINVDLVNLRYSVSILKYWGENNE